MAKQIEYPADTVDSRGKVWDTIPILTNDDVVTFKEKTGIELQQGCYLIPVYTRVA